MDALSVLRQYALDPESSALLLDTCAALVQAEMAESTVLLQTCVFGTGRVVSFDHTARCYRLRPYAELLLLELRAVADHASYSPATKECKARVLIWEAGY